MIKSLIDLKKKLLDIGLCIDNEYLDKYCNLIYSNNDTKREKFKTNRHHIIPRSYFKYVNEEIDNSDDNLVNLLYKDHILAHYYLCFCVSNGLYVKANYAAIIQLCRNRYNTEKDFLNSLDRHQELYELYKKLDSELQKGKPGHKHTEESKLKISKSNTGKICSVETRNKISKTLSGRTGMKRSEETKQKQREAALKRYSNPEERRLQSERTKESNSRPEVKQKIREAKIRLYSNPIEREKQRERMKGRIIKEESRIKNSNSQKLKYILNPELKIKQSIKMKERMKDPKYREYIRCNVIGRRFMNNGIVNKHVKPDEIDMYISKGFIFGLNRSLVRKRI